MTETVEVKLPRRNKRRCGRCAFARMGDNSKEVDMCHYPTLEKPTRIISLHQCPKACQKIGVVIKRPYDIPDRAKGEFEG